MMTTSSRSLDQMRNSNSSLWEMRAVALQDDAPGLRLGFGIW
jgi:hypothetical protein